jgi:hypothetical protein
MSTNARALALQEYDLEVQARRYAELYAGLAHQRVEARLDAAHNDAAASPLGSHFAEVYYRLLLRAMRQRSQYGAEGLPYRRRKFGRQRLVLAWHYLRLYNWVLNRVRRPAARQETR